MKSLKELIGESSSVFYLTVRTKTGVEAISLMSTNLTNAKKEAEAVVKSHKLKKSLVDINMESTPNDIVYDLSGKVK